MKVVVTSQGTELTSEVDPRFGRAKYLLVVDTESGEVTCHDNTQNLNAAQGAGIQAGRNVLDLGVTAVITGNVGPKAFATLQSGGLEVYIGAQGTVEEAVEQFNQGLLDQGEGANVQGHWT
jgi:predicted Fe-Mo cluster-binding NifX family protein